MVAVASAASADFEANVRWRERTTLPIASERIEPKKQLHCLLIFRQRFKWDRAMGQYTLHGWDEVTGASDDFVDNALLS